MIYRILFIALLVTGCKTSKIEEVYDINPEVNFNRILQEEVNTPQNETAGISLTVISPELGLDFSGAAGYDSKDKNTTLKAEQPFRIASLTKTFVASAILRLQEQGLLDINDPITSYISEKHISILEKGGYLPGTITLKHCMMHTSGLYDYAEGGPDYIEMASKSPKKRWTRTEQIQFAMDYGKPLALAGKEHHYSDTGYILLGEIIENITQKGLAEGLRTLLKFDALEMNATWLESLENRPVGLLPSVKRYLGNIDASDWDNSVDLYGGGGLSSTTRDLCIFLQGLFNGSIYENKNTLPVMLLQKDFIPKVKGELPEYRLGFGNIRSKTSDVEAFLHAGFWETIFMHFPKYNCSIAINHTNGDSKTLQKVINYVQWLDKNQKRNTQPY
ncbi:serine hydrolase domain-containing protein [Aquimarina addita]|uniref:Serine hydrolase domain-containing protein n=1 Tax=Aquimarina addita TaxID=870485 RepID=A0ABP6UN62_9FLAO